MANHCRIRFLALLVCMSILGSLLCACNDRTDDGTTAPPVTTSAPDTTAPEETTTPTEETVPPTEETVPPTEETIPQLECPTDGSREFYYRYGNDKYYRMKDSFQSDVTEVQNGDFILHVSSVIGDSRNIEYIYYVEYLGDQDISSMDALDVELEYEFDIVDKRPLGERGGSEYYRVSKAPEAETAGNRIYCYSELMPITPVKTIKLQINGLYESGNEENRMDTDLYVEIPVSCMVPVASGEDATGRFYNLELTSRSLWVECHEPDAETADSGTSRYYDLVIHYKDGTSLAVTAEEFEEDLFSKYGWLTESEIYFNPWRDGNNFSYMCILFGRYDAEFLNPDTVKSISIDGVEIPISIP